MHAVRPATVRPFLLFYLVALAAALTFPARAQQEPPKDKPVEPPPPPAVTATTADTGATQPVPGGPGKPPPDWGRVGREHDTLRVLTAGSMQWIERISFGDVAESIPGIWMRDQQSAGQYNALNARGSDWRSVAIMRNGRLMNDPASGIYNPFHANVDDLAEAEIISGPRAFVYALNSTGAAVNLVPRSFFSSRPYTRLAYIQGPYEYSFTDGVYSQNMLRALNLYVGFQGQSTAGRLPNSAHRAWNLRTRLTYQLADDASVTVSEYFTGTKTSMNAGFRSPDADPTVPAASAVVNTDSYEKLTRHDVDATLAARLIGDSTDVSALTLYYSHNLREYRDEELGSSPNGLSLVQDHRTSWMGAQIQQIYTGGPQRLSFGAGVEIRQIEGSHTLGRRRNVIGHVRAVEEISLPGPVRIGLFGRYDRYLNDDHLGAGADARFQVTDDLAVLAGYSASARVPTYSELYWTDPDVGRPGEVTAERHTMAEAGVEFRPAPGAAITLSYGARSVRDPVLLSASGTINSGTLAGHGALYPGFQITNGPDLLTHSLEAGVRARFWYVLLEGTFLWTVQESDGGGEPDLYPEIAARGGVYFRTSLFNGSLDLKTGFRGTYQAESRGAYFDQVALAYADHPGAAAPGGSSVDFLLTAGIGDAVIYFTWENLADQLWYRTPYYPIRDRGIRFGLSWEFLD